MELTRDETVAGLLDEYAAFVALMRDLSAEEWNTSSRCAGWEVRDIAGHVVATAEDVLNGTVGQRTGDEQAKDNRDVPAAELADRLEVAAGAARGLLESFDDAAWAAPSGVHDGTLGNGVRLLWYDTYVHADDIRAAVGRATVDSAGLKASVVYLEEELAKREWKDDAGDVSDRDFVLAATGRIDANAVGLDPRVNIYAD